MRYHQFTVREVVDKQKFFSQEAVEPVINFPPRLGFDGKPSSYTQTLCKIGSAEHVMVFTDGGYTTISFFADYSPGDLEDVATCIEYAGGRLFDSRRRVYGRKKKAAPKQG